MDTKMTELRRSSRERRHVERLNVVDYLVPSSPESESEEMKPHSAPRVSIQDHHDASSSWAAAAATPINKRYPTRNHVTPSSVAHTAHATPSSSVVQRGSKRNHVTPSSVKSSNKRPKRAAYTTPGDPESKAGLPIPSKEDQKVPSSLKLPKESPERASRTAPDRAAKRRAASKKSSRSESKAGLANLAKNFTAMVAVSKRVSNIIVAFLEIHGLTNPIFCRQKSGTCNIDLEKAIKYLGIPRRRIYDVVNILDGAGLLKRQEEKQQYVWIGGTATEALEDRREEEREALEALEEEEKQIDEWVCELEAKAKMQYSHMTSDLLVPLLEQDSAFLTIATPRHSILHLPHDLEERRDADHFSFTLIPPKNYDARRSVLPRAYLLESADAPMRLLSLTPPPPLFETCTSDFSFHALRNTGLGGVFSAEAQEVRQSHPFEQMFNRATSAAAAAAACMPTVLQESSSLVWCAE